MAATYPMSAPRSPLFYSLAACIGSLIFACITAIMCYMLVQYQGLQQALQLSNMTLERMHDEVNATQNKLMAVQGKLADLEKQNIVVRETNIPPPVQQANAAVVQAPPVPVMRAAARPAISWHAISVKTVTWKNGRMVAE